MGSKRRKKIHDLLQEWIPVHDRLEGGELYTLKGRGQEILAIGDSRGGYSHGFISSSSVKFIKDGAWHGNSLKNPFPTRIIEAPRYAWSMGKMTQQEAQDDMVGFLMHDSYRYMAMSSLFEPMFRNAKAQLGANLSISGIYGTVSWWMKFDKYLFLPVAMLVRNKSTSKSEIRQITANTTFPILSPWIDRPSYNPESK